MARKTLRTQAFLVLLVLMVASLSVKHSAPGAIAKLSSCTPATADGFDYPVGKPNHDGWGILEGFDVKQVYANWPHAAEDWQVVNSRGQLDGIATEGQPVYATANGEVEYAEEANYPGKVAIVRHQLADGSQVYSMYGHLATLELAVDRLLVPP